MPPTFSRTQRAAPPPPARSGGPGPGSSGCTAAGERPCPRGVGPAGRGLGGPRQGPPPSPSPLPPPPPSPAIAGSSCRSAILGRRRRRCPRAAGPAHLAAGRVGSAHRRGWGRGEGWERPQPELGYPRGGGAVPALGGGTSGTRLHSYWLTCKARFAPLDLGLAEGRLPVTRFRYLRL